MLGMLWILVGCDEGLLVRPWPENGSTGTVDTVEDPNRSGPELYPDDRVQSPVPPSVAASMRAIAARGSGQPDVFMKIGASSTVSGSTLYCFAGDDVDLDLYYDALEDTWLYLLEGDAAGTTPFDRDTEAAISGKTAAWAISGDPSPVDEEIAAIDPSLAVIHYGTNDMGMGSTYESAMPGFYESMADLIDGLMDQGIVPVLTGISHRGDRTSADLWVESYNAVIRGMAQVRQIPFIDLHLAMDPLEGHGLASDGIHLNGYSEGSCILTPEGLEHGYNMRNLIVLEAFDRVVKVLQGEEAALDDVVSPIRGQGTPDAPVLVEKLPFADRRNTADSMYRDLSLYTGCDSDADESGPEVTYRLHLDQETSIRAMVLDEGDTDIDLHLLDDSVSEAGCLARAHRTLEGTLPPGDYAFVLDSWVDGEGDERTGEYLFVVQACEPDDDDCSEWLN